MSDYRAVAGITAVLRDLVQQAVDQARPGARVTLAKPRQNPVVAGEGEVQLFLYLVESNPYLRNAQMPMRDPDGGFVNVPQVALNLHYLLSFYGDETKFVPQLLLGATVTALHTFATPSPQQIRQVLAGASADVSLEGCGLAEQAQALSFVPIPFTHDEMSRLWAVFFQVPYSLSVAYRCAVVLLEPDVLPTSVPPVRRPVVAVGGPAPRLTGVEPQVVSYADGPPELTLTGTGLASPRPGGTRVFFDERGVVPRRLPGGALAATLPEGLPAGMRSVRVLQEEPAGEDAPDTGGGGEGGTARRGSRSLAGLASPAIASNALSFIVEPVIEEVVFRSADNGSPVADEDRLQVTATPPLYPWQRAQLLLDPLPPAPGEGVTIPAERLQGEEPGGGAGAAVLDFDAHGVPEGDYLVRLSVDGVESLLGTGEDGLYNRPSVRIDRGGGR